MSKIAKQLQTAIADRNEEEASSLAEQLAQKRIRIRFYADPESSPGSGGLLSSAEDGSVIVSVTFQVGPSRVSRPVRLVLPRAACVADLKAETLMSFDLPQDIQRCIVKNRLARDEETLGDLLNEAPVQGNSHLQVRTYLHTHDSNLWPPEPEHLNRLKTAVQNEKRRKSTVAGATPEDGSAGSIDQPDEEYQQLHA